jgi:photosynthetic reaction center cytochrome c subunit
MRRHSTTIRSARAVGALTALCVSYAQTAPPAGHVKSTEEVYKNIQVLKGIPADQLVPAMQFITASLGVECSFCHVENHFEEDDKRPKETARKMIRMVTRLNHDDVFGGKPEVTCNTCHRGTRLPLSIPVINEQPAVPATIEQARQELANLPRADQILNKYVEALGGADAIRNLTTLVETATTTIASTETTVEIFDRSPDKRSVITHLPSGDNFTVFDGVESWIAGPNRPLRKMPSADLPGAKMDADLQFALHTQEFFGKLKAAPSEKLNGEDAYQFIGERDGQPTGRLYFSKESGLLLRVLRYSASPLGLNPTRIDYSDYRPVEGVKIPYRWTAAQAFGQFTIQVTDAKINVPVDEQKFEKPLETERQSAK